MIAFVSQRFPAPTETFTAAEVRALRDEGLDVVVYSLRPGDAPAAGVHVLPAAPGPALRALAHWLVRRPVRLLRTLAWLRPSAAGVAAIPRGALLAREPRVTLYHAQFAFEAATAALVAAHLSGRRFSFRSHTGPRPPALRAKLRRAAVVLSISDYDRERLLEVEPSAHVVVSRLGVELPPEPAVREPALIASVGSLIEKKGHHVLLEACALLAERAVDFRCEIAGEGPEHERLERLAGPWVTLRGATPHDEALRLLRLATVAVLASVPSAREGVDGIPVSLMEALAAGTPVVSTPISGIPELVVDGETGLLVPPGDAAALADALESLLADEELRRRLGAAGRRLVAERFDAARSYAHAAELLRSASS